MALGSLASVMSTAAPDRYWKPLVYFWDGGWIGVGAGSGEVPPHAHHAVQISLGLTAPVRLRHADGDWMVADGGVVLPNAPHGFNASGAVVAMIFIDPECREGRWLRQSFRTPIALLDATRYAAYRERLLAFGERRPSIAEAAALITGVVRSLCEGPPPQRVMDDRIMRALAFVRGRDARGLTLERVAREVFLSPSRFAHLFTEEVGLPFRRYVLWRKLARAIGEFGRGGTLSAAAHAAGFSDSAHLTRTFYQMFGIPPTLMMGSAEFHEIPAPFDLAPPPT
jgi:AraC family transcriptional regulator